MEVLNNIPIKLNLEAVLERMHVSNKSRSIINDIQELIEIARPIAKPKAIYKLSYVENKREDSVDIEGVRFISKVLRVNLDQVGRVFPYIVTCGVELDQIDSPSEEFLRTYYIDQIKETVLILARSYLEDYLKERYALGQVSRMAPGAGSEEDWPIAQQEGLFSIFGSRVSIEDLIGVKLTDRLLMIPIKSVSGIFFPTEIRFETCQLCPRDSCVGRRAPYDKDLVKKYKEAVY